MEESLDLKSLLKEIESANPTTIKKISQRQISKAKILNKGSRFKKGELRGKEFTLENGLKITIKTDEEIGKKTQNFIFINGGLAKAKESLKDIRELLKNESLSVKEKRAALAVRKALDEYIEYRTKTNKASKARKAASKTEAKRKLEKVNPLYLKEMTEKIDAFYSRDLENLSDEEKTEAYDSFIQELEEDKRRITAESVTYQNELNAQLDRLELLQSTTSDYASQDFIDNLQDIADKKAVTMPVLENMAAATELINKTIKELKVKSFPSLDRVFNEQDEKEPDFGYSFEDDDAPNSEKFKVNFHSIGRFFFRRLDGSQRKLLRQAAYAADKYGRGATVDDLGFISKFFSGLPLKRNNQRAMRSLDIETVDVFELFDFSDEEVDKLHDDGYLIHKMVRRPMKRFPTPQFDISALKEPEKETPEDPNNGLEDLFEELSK